MITKPCPKHLTVIFRDDAPLIHCGDSPSYRSVTIELTEEQRDKLSLRSPYSSGGTRIYEDISRCFIEDKGGAE